MAGRGRGRGRGFRVNISTPMREPDPDTVARLVGSASAGITVTVEGQFTDVPPQRTGQTSQQQTQPQQQSPQQEDTQKQQRGIAVTSMATNGQLSSPQDTTAGGTSGSQGGKSSAKISTLPSELKAALKEGAKVANPLSQEFPSTTYTSAKLNPTAQPFSPFTSVSQPSGFNPNSTEFLPTPTMTPSLSNPSLIITKTTLSSTQTPESQNASSSSSLNPNSEVFVPKTTTLNIAAPEFVPKIGLPPSMQNGDASLPEKVDDLELDLLQLKYNEVENPVLEPQDIMDGFERVVTEDVEGGSDRNSPLLKVVAEILIKGTLYPGSFEKHVMKIEESIQQLPPSQETLQNLAEMIAHWGIGEPGLRYTASRLCQVLCEMKPIAGFNKILMRRLQVWFLKMKELITKTEEKEAFINFAFFYAEAFARVRLNDSPFHVLGVAIFELVQKLLSVKEDKLVMVGCSILKLTGNLLEECEKNGSTSKMDQVVEMLKKLAIDESLSSHCQDLVIRVIQLQAVKWGKGMKYPPPPTSTSTLTPDNQQPPFHELIFQPDQAVGVQLPVTNPDDWSEYVDEDDLVVEDTDEPDFLPGDLDSEGMDPDMEDEFEAFIDEIEDHLLMQDFDPDVQYDVPGSQ